MESDARSVVAAIKEQTLLDGHQDLLKDIANLLLEDWQVEFDHVYREANQCADAMTRVGVRQLNERKVWLQARNHHPCWRNYCNKT